MRIISIDPGYERLGIAILEKEKKSQEVLLYSDCFFTSKKLSHPERLTLVGKELEKLILEYKPEALSIETLFFNTNQKTAFFVAEARGVIVYEAKKQGLFIREFTPQEIKIAVTGHGRSDKTQVTSMVEKLVKISKKIKYDDEYDAIAAGITFFATHR
jgi:crossover junction endodeoxyribonuclease RuvC